MSLSRHRGLWKGFAVLWWLRAGLHAILLEEGGTRLGRCLSNCSLVNKITGLAMNNAEKQANLLHPQHEESPVFAGTSAMDTNNIYEHRIALNGCLSMHNGVPVGWHKSLALPKECHKSAVKHSRAAPPRDRPVPQGQSDQGSGEAGQEGWGHSRGQAGGEQEAGQGSGTLCQFLTPFLGSLSQSQAAWICTTS